MRWKRILPFVGLATGVFVLLVICVCFALSPFRNLDILIENGSVLNGMGGPPVSCDVGIRDGKIVALGRWRFFFAQPKLRINARGRIVAPGFIDVHTHVEPNLPRSGPFQAANFLRQGVTTVITGNCGRSATDLEALFKSLEKNGTHINLATLVGHNSIRKEVMGSAARAPTAEELLRMERLVDRAMANGALGLSTGLVYVPGRFADHAEIAALARIAAINGGLYVSHIRDEGHDGIKAIREALEIGRLSGAQTHISHFKSSGPLQWRSASIRLQLLDDARKANRQVTIDVYPYDRSSTTTDVLLPDWAVKEGNAGLRLASRSPKARERLHHDILAQLRRDGWNDLRHILLASGSPEWIGRTLAEVPRPAFDVNQQIENLITISFRGGAQAIYADMTERDVDEIIAYPFCVFGSDSAVRDPDTVYKPHPRGCGTFPRVFRRYVRETKTLSLTQAVTKASGQAADIFGLEHRGHLTIGNWADIVIFDQETVGDQADYTHPFAEPLGIDYVLVNGVVAVDHGNLTSNGPSGAVLRKAGGRNVQRSE